MMKNFALINYGFRDLSPLNCGSEDCEPLHSAQGRGDKFLIHFVISGRGRFAIDGVEYHPEAGQAFLIRPGQLYLYEADELDPWTYVWMGFEGERAEELLDNSDFKLAPIICPPEKFGEIFTQMGYHADESNSLELTVCAKLFEALATIQKEGAATKLAYHSEHVARTVDYIRANFASEVSIAGISELLNIDRRYLCRIFCAEVGMTPKEFLVETRLRHASELLCESEYPVGEVARFVGYDDAFNFSKMFKRAYGMSPSEYRNAHMMR